MLERKIGATLALALLVMLLAAGAQTATAVKSTTISAAVVPAPFGYSLMFSNPQPITVYGYETQGNNYYQYPAELPSDGTYILATSAISDVSYVYTNLGLEQLQIITPESLDEAYIVDTPSGRYLIYSGNDNLFYSPYLIFYEQQPNASALQAFLVTYNEVNFTWAGNELVFVAPPYGPGTGEPSLTVIWSGGMTSMTLDELLNLPAGCLTWFGSNGGSLPQWAGGVVDSVACTANIVPITTITVNGQNYIVVFAAATRYGHISYVVLGWPSVSELVQLGLLQPLGTDGGLLHIVSLSSNEKYVYVFHQSSATLQLIEPVFATDITEQLSNGSLACVIPQSASVVYYLLWRYRQLQGTVIMMPGEFVLLEYNGTYYYCHGQLGWLTSNMMPLAVGPRYSEITYPIHIYSPVGMPFLLVMSDGTVMEATSTSVPWSTYEHNVIIVVTGAGAEPIRIYTTSIFVSPTTVLATIIVMVTGVVIARSRKTRPVPKITVVYDVAPPAPAEFAPEDLTRDTVQKYVDTYGVCPDALDLADRQYGILTPIPYDLRGEPPLVCNFKTWGATERALKDVARIFRDALWYLKRSGPSYGFFLTSIGEYTPYVYMYKQEEGESPPLTLIRAFESAYHMEKGEIATLPGYKVSKGLVIVVSDDALDDVKKEVDILFGTVKPGASGGRQFSITAYASQRGLNVSVPPTELDTFANEKIHRIVVVSRSNLRELVEFIADITEEEVMKIRGFVGAQGQ